MTNSARLVWITPEAEKVIAYCARVSSEYQDNPSYERLFAYLLKHKHWSPFEMASMCVKIETTRMISAQILRHRSFSFQEFSLRYAEALAIEHIPARGQDHKNRQASHDNMAQSDKDWFQEVQQEQSKVAMANYGEALERGIAKECARALLPLSTSTCMYMTGSIRSWIHYLDVRCNASTQLEHRLIANEILAICQREMPTIFPSSC